MRKFGIVSGFLGAGKTTAMIALHQYFTENGISCSLIANDLGECEMVDAAYSEKQGAEVHSMPGGCICFRTQELTEVLDEAFSAGTELVLSDIPGCGVGALDYVYRKTAGGDTQLAPFIALVSPQQLALLSDEDAFYRIHLPREMALILRAQLMEADAAVLTKTDTISPAEAESAVSLIKSVCPGITVFRISAKTGEGIPALGAYLLSGTASLTQPEGLGDQKELEDPEGMFSWYDCRYYAKVCCDDFHPDEYLADLMETARFSFAAMNANTPHMKIFASAGDDYAKYSLTGIDFPLEKDHLFGRRAVDLSVIINARLLCTAPLAEQIMKASIDAAGKKHNLDTMIFSVSCR